MNQTAEGAVDIERRASVLASANAYATTSPGRVSRTGSPRAESVEASKSVGTREDAEQSDGLVLELSTRAREAVADASAEAEADADEDSRGDASGKSSEATAGESGERSAPGELSETEEEEVRSLEKRDAEVRAHENAHKAAAGRHARGGPKYEFERGPDGRRYAVGGEVSIDTSPISGDPDATIRKMQQVRRAALAPAEPSPQDRRVAAEASQAETRARAEKLEEKGGAENALGVSNTAPGEAAGRMPGEGEGDERSMNALLGRRGYGISQPRIAGDRIDVRA